MKINEIKSLNLCIKIQRTDRKKDMIGFQRDPTG